MASSSSHNISRMFDMFLSDSGCMCRLESRRNVRPCCADASGTMVFNSRMTEVKQQKESSVVGRMFVENLYHKNCAPHLSRNGR